LRDLPAGTATFVFAEPLGPPNELMAELARAYPGLGPPDHDMTGPAATYRILGYEFESGSELATYGLWGDYVSPGGTSASRIDPLHDLTWDDASLLLEPPFTASWRGVVYVEEPATLGLHALTDDPVQVLLDGAAVYSTLNGQDQRQFLGLLPGWHVVEVTLERQSVGGSLRLAWLDAEGNERPLAAQDLFPLADLSGWLHERSLGLEGSERQLVTQRLDFAPHLASTRAARLVATTGEPYVTQERWRGVLDVGLADTLTFEATFLAGTLTLSIDDAPVAVEEASPNVPTLLEAVVQLQAGRHTVELFQELAFDVPWSGARLSIQSALGSGVIVRPY
jgi:hypothetical protein